MLTSQFSWVIWLFIVTSMKFDADIIIVGGGIAGLWALHKLKQQGYRVILLESKALGAGQTVKSQGIIHGGLKYALTGSLNAATNALRDMPSYWQQCLAGTGAIDLSATEILATGQYMWSVNTLTSGITTLFASSAMRSQVQIVDKSNWPIVLQKSAIKGKLYQLEELVLNINSLLKSLATPVINNCLKINTLNVEFDSNNNIKFLTTNINEQFINLTAQRYIFTAGSGNQELLNTVYPDPVMQLRPLHMVLVKDLNLPAIFGHCVDLSFTPRITITTHTARNGLPVWYLGGKLAENGIHLTSEQQINIARQELKILFPQLDLSAAQWASFYVDRAEAKQLDGSKPNSASILVKNNYITAWPTKLALAPVLAEQIYNNLQTQQINPNTNLSNTKFTNIAPPTIAAPIWDQLL